MLPDKYKKPVNNSDDLIRRRKKNLKIHAIFVTAVLFCICCVQLHAQSKEYIYLDGKLVAVEADGDSSICTYTISPTSNSFGTAGGSGTISVTASYSSCARTATSNVGWITVTGGASGSGNGTVSYSIAANEGPARSGTITVAGQTFTISQSNGCTYTISPTSASFGIAGGSGSIAVTSGAGCTWTATDNRSWITITSGSSGSGNGTVGYTVAANPSPARSGAITVAGLTATKIFSISQPNGCTYSISPTGTNVPYAGGSGGVSVSCSSSSCPWTATESLSWVTITGGSSGTGNGTMNYSVAYNTGGARSGSATVAGKTFTVNQAINTCYYDCQTNYVGPCYAYYEGICASQCQGNQSCYYMCIYSMQPVVNEICTVDYCIANFCQ